MPPIFDVAGGVHDAGEVHVHYGIYVLPSGTHNHKVMDYDGQKWMLDETKRQWYGHAMQGTCTNKYVPRDVMHNQIAAKRIVCVAELVLPHVPYLDTLTEHAYEEVLAVLMCAHGSRCVLGVVLIQTGVHIEAIYRRLAQAILRPPVSAALYALGVVHTGSSLPFCSVEQHAPPPLQNGNAQQRASPLVQGDMLEPHNSNMYPDQALAPYQPYQPAAAPGCRQVGRP